MKKTYVSPRAELICFVPEENLASWNLDGNKNWKFFNHWGSLSSDDTSPQVSGIMNWYDDLTNKKVNDLD